MTKRLRKRCGACDKVKKLSEFIYPNELPHRVKRNGCEMTVIALDNNQLRHLKDMLSSSDEMSDVLTMLLRPPVEDVDEEDDICNDCNNKFMDREIPDSKQMKGFFDWVRRPNDLDMFNQLEMRLICAQGTKDQEAIWS